MQPTLTDSYEDYIKAKELVARYEKERTTLQEYRKDRRAIGTIADYDADDHERWLRLGIEHNKQRLAKALDRDRKDRFKAKEKCVEYRGYHHLNIEQARKDLWEGRKILHKNHRKERYIRIKKIREVINS